MRNVLLIFLVPRRMNKYYFRKNIKELNVKSSLNEHFAQQVKINIHLNILFRIISHKKKSL